MTIFSDKSKEYKMADRKMAYDAMIENYENTIIFLKANRK